MTPPSNLPSSQSRLPLTTKSPANTCPWPRQSFYVCRHLLYFGEGRNNNIMSSCGSWRSYPGHVVCSSPKRETKNKYYPTLHRNSYRLFRYHGWKRVDELLRILNYQPEVNLALCGRKETTLFLRPPTGPVTRLWRRGGNRK